MSTREQALQIATQHWVGWKSWLRKRASTLYSWLATDTAWQSNSPLLTKPPNKEHTLIRSRYLLSVEPLHCLATHKDAFPGPDRDAAKIGDPRCRIAGKRLIVGPSGNQISTWDSLTEPSPTTFLFVFFDVSTKYSIPKRNYFYY
jgi:hypothetical protein